MSWSDLALSLSALPPLAISVYLAVLAIFAKRNASPVARRPHLKFDVVIPAHNEQEGVGATIESVLAVAYPRQLFRVLVIADNCCDRTAERAAQAGAQVLVRHAPQAKGKGHALAYAFETIVKDPFADVIVVIDADTTVSGNLLTAFSAGFEAGVVAVQADYGVRNPRASWRTRIMSMAFTAFHTLRSLARDRFGLSCGLRGNGMAFTTALLRAIPYQAFSLVEDVEYGIALGLGGVRVQYVAEASVLGDMCQTETGSRSQRRRWEMGRSALIRRYAGKLICDAWHRRDPMLFDLATDLLIPPLTQIVAVILAGTVVSAFAASSIRSITVGPWLWSLAMAAILVYLGRAWALSGAGLRGLWDLLWAPAYMFWKLTLIFKSDPNRRSDWIRTTREPRI
jgi:1,2-diacylglycerol 3-beta-glucosyltransferase